VILNNIKYCNYWLSRTCGSHINFWKISRQ